jgi:uncharacterized DUF497 family protein
MKITFDPDKRAITLERRGLDFADASEVSPGATRPSRTSGWSTENLASSAPAS